MVKKPHSTKLSKPDKEIMNHSQKYPKYLQFQFTPTQWYIFPLCCHKLHMISG